MNEQTKTCKYSAKLNDPYLNRTIGLKCVNHPKGYFN